MAGSALNFQRKFRTLPNGVFLYQRFQVGAVTATLLIETFETFENLETLETCIDARLRIRRHCRSHNHLVLPVCSCSPKDARRECSESALPLGRAASISSLRNVVAGTLLASFASALARSNFSSAVRVGNRSIVDFLARTGGTIAH